MISRIVLGSKSENVFRQASDNYQAFPELVWMFGPIVLEHVSCNIIRHKEQHACPIVPCILYIFTTARTLNGNEWS